MRKFVAGGLLIGAGVTAAVVTTFQPGEDQGKYNVCYVANAGGNPSLEVGVALEARADLMADFSPIEKGEASFPGSQVRFTVRTFAITEAEANSVNASCLCLKVDDLETPTGLVPR